MSFVDVLICPLNPANPQSLLGSLPSFAGLVSRSNHSAGNGQSCLVPTADLCCNADATSACSPADAPQHKPQKVAARLGQDFIWVVCYPRANCSFWGSTTSKATATTAAEPVVCNADVTTACSPTPAPQLKPLEFARRLGQDLVWAVPYPRHTCSLLCSAQHPQQQPHQLLKQCFGLQMQKRLQFH